MKHLLLPLLLPLSLAVHAQPDSTHIRNIYYHAMKLTEAKADSIDYYAQYMGRVYDAERWPEARVMSLRLYGFYQENKANYPRAIDYYLQALEAARKSRYISQETLILADLAKIYTSDIKQPAKARRSTWNVSASTGNSATAIPLSIPISISPPSTSGWACMTAHLSC